MRNDHRQNDGAHHEAVALELELGKSVADEAGNKGLQNRRRRGEEQRVEECGNIVVLNENRLILVEGRILRNQHDRDIDEVIRAHKRCRNLREERVQNDVRDAEQNDEAEQVDEDIRIERPVAEFRFQSFLQRSPVEVDPDFVFGFFRNLGLCIHGLTPPFSVFSLVEHECRHNRGDHSQNQDNDEEVHPRHCRRNDVAVRL